MTTCQSCQAARETNGCWTTYDSPKCIFCAARQIQQIGKLRTPTSAEITARRRVVLAGAVAWGHSEAQIRELAKSKQISLQPKQGGSKQL